MEGRALPSGSVESCSPSRSSRGSPRRCWRSQIKVAPISGLEATSTGVLGAVLVCAGIVLSLLAQHALGVSWRIGVDESERTALVTTGIFARVRNPFFTASGLVAVGLVLMVPSVLAIAACAALVVAVELQVRVVEEPYLLRVQGAIYSEYARRTGRFVPGVGSIQVRAPEV